VKCAAGLSTAALAVEGDWGQVGKAFGKSGSERPGGVYRTGLPRTPPSLVGNFWYFGPLGADFGRRSLLAIFSISISVGRRPGRAMARSAERRSKGGLNASQHLAAPGDPASVASWALRNDVLAGDCG
jgi:hypothetical protein